MKFSDPGARRLLRSKRSLSGEEFKIWYKGVILGKIWGKNFNPVSLAPPLAPGRQGGKGRRGEEEIFDPFFSYAVLEFPEKRVQNLQLQRPWGPETEKKLKVGAPSGKRGRRAPRGGEGEEKNMAGEIATADRF